MLIFSSMFWTRPFAACDRGGFATDASDSARKRVRIISRVGGKVDEKVEAASSRLRGRQSGKAAGCRFYTA